MGYYNRIAGQSVGRIEALSDGVFAVAMTLLVLDLHAPAVEAVHGEADLQAALLHIAPRLLIYMMSFLTLGIFWVGQQTQLNQFARSDRTLTWIQLGFLFAVTLMPFSTALMAEHVVYRTALLVYWANVLLLGLLLLITWRYAKRADLVAEDAPEGITVMIQRRILVAQALYAFGAALCAISTYWSIGFILLVQLNYAVGPRRGLLARL